MKNTELKAILQQHSAEHIINTLSPFILDRRKERIESVIQNRIEDITIAIEQPSDMHNALAVIRSAEAFGLACVHIIAPEHEVTSIRSLTQGTCYWIKIIYHDSFETFYKTIKAQQMLLAGAVVDTTQSISTLSVEKPICLIFGNEVRGLSDTALTHCDALFTIPMRGMAESLNLSVAAAVSMFDLTQRKDQTEKTSISENTSTALRAQYYLNSVNQRTIMHLLKKQIAQ